MLQATPELLMDHELAGLGRVGLLSVCLESDTRLNEGQGAIENVLQN